VSLTGVDVDTNRAKVSFKKPRYKFGSRFVISVAFLETCVPQAFEINKNLHICPNHKR
jgi:hypothetical protein